MSCVSEYFKSEFPGCPPTEHLKFVARSELMLQDQGKSRGKGCPFSSQRMAVGLRAAAGTTASAHGHCEPNRRDTGYQQQLMSFTGKGNHTGRSQ